MQTLRGHGGLVMPAKVKVWASLLVAILYLRETDKEKGAIKSGMYNLSFYHQGGGRVKSQNLFCLF